MFDTRDTILDEETIETFERDGVVHLRGILTDGEIAGLRRAVGRQMAGAGQSSTAYDFQSLAEQFFSPDAALDTGNATRLDMAFFRDAVRSDSEARLLLDGKADGRAKGEEGKFFYEVAGWLHHEEIRRVALEGILPRLSAELMRSERVCFWEDTTFVKEPGATVRTNFHCDYGYFQISGEDCVIVWVPLDKADAENGALEVVKGSHRWGRTFQPNVFFANTPFPGTEGERLPDIEADREAYEDQIELFAAEPGDIVVCHVKAIHGAPGNSSQDRVRRVVSLRYTGDDVRYYDKPGALRQPWLTHDLRDGDVLETADFPEVWPRQARSVSLTELYAEGLAEAAKRLALEP